MRLWQPRCCFQLHTDRRTRGSGSATDGAYSRGRGRCVPAAAANAGVRFAAACGRSLSSMFYVLIPVVPHTTHAVSAGKKQAEFKPTHYVHPRTSPSPSWLLSSSMTMSPLLLFFLPSASPAAPAAAAPPLASGCGGGVLGSFRRLPFELLPPFPLEMELVGVVAAGNAVLGGATIALLSTAAPRRWWL